MINWRALTVALSQTTSRHAPGWTDHNEADPGVTLIELIAFLSEHLYRDVGRVEGAAAAAGRVVRALQPYTDTVPPGVGQPDPSLTAVTCWSGHMRPRFYSGQLLSADDLSQEQSYHLAAHRRHLSTMHGFGVVSGLEVGVGPDGGSVVVDAGYALDPEGREILFPCAAAMILPDRASTPLWVALEHVERRAGEVATPSTGADDGDPTLEASRIEDGCRLSLVDAVREPMVAVGRLIYEAERWRVDPSFAPPRPR